MGTTRAALGNSAYDDSDSYPFVVALSKPGEGVAGAYCSGTMVGPRRVLTAAHCFFERGRTQAEVDIHVITYVSGLSAVRTHRLKASGPIVMLTQSTGSGSDDSARGPDLAVVPLDEPFYDPTIPFVPIASPSDPCEEDFEGTLVGFGSVVTSDVNGCSTDKLHRRSAVTSGDWSLHEDVSSAYYRQSYAFSYKGGAPGDSGGPLLHGGKVCGVISGGDYECFAGQMAGYTTCAAPQGGLDGFGPNDSNIIERITKWKDPRTGEEALVGMCPSVYAPAGTTPAWMVKDTDHDEVPDICDTCPGVPNPKQRETIEDDADDDGVVDACDRCPGPDRDSDGDGIYDCVDPCPCSPPGTGDPDGDKVCSTCEPTLFDALAKSPLNICAKLCEGFVPDNCPTISNPSQSNCNARAENARGALVLGDACDPVPCPSFSPSYGTEPDHPEVLVSSHPIGNGNYIGETSTYVATASGLSLFPIGSHGSAASKRAGEHVPVGVFSSDYRFCRQDQTDCYANDSTDDSHLSLAKARQDELPQQPWHRMSFVEIPSVDKSDGLYIYKGVGPIDRTWNATADWAFWAMKFKWSLPASPGDAPGVLWAHGNTAVGMSNTSYATGFHGLAVQPEVASDGLANHYEDVVSVREYTVTSYKKLAWLQGAPYTEHNPLADCVNCAAEWVDSRQRGYPPMLLQLDKDQPGWVGSLRPDGTVLDLGKWYGPGLRQSLAAGVKLTGQAEVSSTIGTSAGRPAAVGFSADGTALVEKAFARPTGLAGLSDARGGGRSALSGGEPFGAGAAGPSARHAFLPVYSRAMGRAFVVGGIDDSTGKPTGDIWSISVDGGSWVPVVAGAYRPAKVLAATFSYQDQRLWILDEVKVGPLHFARLVRLDPTSGTLSPVGLWPRLGAFDKHWLQLDRDGHVLLVASSHSTKAHAAVRLVVSGDEVDVDTVLLGKHALAVAPVVSEAGYSLALERPGLTPKRVDVPSLSWGKGTWKHVAGCL